MRRLLFLFCLVWLVACDSEGGFNPPVTPTRAAIVPSVMVEQGGATETAVLLTPTPLPATSTPLPAPPTWPAPMVAVEPFARPANAAEQTTWLELSQANPPARDDVSLALAYQGRTAQATPPALVSESLPVGSQQVFNIVNFDNNTVVPIEAVLLIVSDHAYFWFDIGSGSVNPGEAELVQVAAVFDTIYETNTFYFGNEANPGIDGDPRLHIVHASPLALCDVSLSTADLCSLAGYFSSRDIVPQTADPASNAREMFVMNASYFGSNFYLNVLGHEFRHMIEENHDSGDEDWEVEGSAVLAEELLGYPEVGQERGNLFLNNPDQQLNSWTDGNPIPYYGQGYVLNRYIFDRLGVELYRQFATHPANGLRAIDAVAQENGLTLSGESLFLDWLAMLAIHNEPNVPEIYQFQGAPLETAASVRLRLPDTIQTTVAQYAADYYELPGSGNYTVQFTGNSLVPLLDTLPASGQTLWYAQRSNYSNPRLTRQVDLRHVAAATLQYMVYTDIEHGYDFAYVSVSADGGQTWQGVVAENMQGLDLADNPSGSALTGRFYTGRSQGWVPEVVDLSAYAGQLIHIRFEYVTDPILTFGGFALDNIAIPEIGFYDDVEQLVEGWVAEGFSRATGYLSQGWSVQLVTFAGGVPVVQHLVLDGNQQVSVDVDGAESGGKRPILIITALAPLTLERGIYEVVVGE